VHTSGYQSAEVSAGWRRLFLVDCPQRLNNAVFGSALQFRRGPPRDTFAKQRNPATYACRGIAFMGRREERFTLALGSGYLGKRR
jgi:hypothetical protein